MAESNNEKKEKKSGFIVRFISAIVLIAIAVFGLYFGGWVTTIILCGIALVGVFELLRVFEVHKSMLAYTTYAFTVLYYILLRLEYNIYILPLFILYLLILLTIYVMAYPKYQAKDIANTFFAYFYVAVCLSYIALLRDAKDGGWFVALIFITACGNDIFAYLVGITLGKHKMFPVLSPKKSVEGFIGGIVGATLCGFVYGLLFKNYADMGDLNYPLIFAVISGIGALPAVVGDLAASAIKRNHEIKDYGKLIPGHGGILDRFDSMIFTAPIVYYLIIFLLDSYF